MSFFDFLEGGGENSFIPPETFWMTPGLCKPISELLQMFQLTVGLKQHLEFHCGYCLRTLQSNQLDKADEVSMNTAIKQLIIEILALYLFQL